MRILITGGCGYVGSVLTERLLDEGFELLVVDSMWFGNYLQPNKNLEILKHDCRDVSGIPLDRVDAIVHLANVANDPSVELSPELAWEVNTLATMQLADHARRKGVKHFVYASSGSVYGVKEEPQVTEDLSLVPISAYNKTKMVSERVLLSYGNDMLIQCVRPATVCGLSPRMRLDLSVNLLTMQALTNGRITVFGGDQYRPNIHIKDLVEVYVHLLRRGGDAVGCFNAGFENMSILEIAEQVVDAVPAEIIVSESSDPRSYRLNSDKLCNTGFTPSYRVSDGIREVVDAYHSGRLVDEDNCYNVRWMKKTLF